MKKLLKNNKGFSLIELIVVIAIMIILIALLVPNVLGYVDKTEKLAVMEEAKVVYEAAQITMATEWVNNATIFTDESKYGTYNGQKVGFFTNWAIAYNQDNSGHTNGAGMSEVDNLIARGLLEQMGWADANATRYPFKSTAVACDKTVNEYEKQNHQPGIVVLYDNYGAVTYFEWGRNGYLVRIMDGGNTMEVEKNGKFIRRSGGGTNFTFG